MIWEPSQSLTKDNLTEMLLGDVILHFYGSLE